MNHSFFLLGRLGRCSVIVTLWACLGLARLSAQPFIVSVVPADGASGVSPTASVVFTFSEQMDITLTSAQFLGGLSLVPVSSVWSGANTVLTCTPLTSFPANTTITWFVDGENLPGDPLEGDGFGFFTTSVEGGGGGSGTNRLTSFSMGKYHYYNQSSAAAPVIDAQLPYNFTALTTLSSNRTASFVTVTLPTGSISNLTANPLQPENYFLFTTTSTANDLNAVFPAGNYVFTVISSTNQSVAVNLPAGWVQPPAPRVSNYAAAQAVNPAQNFQLTWDAFAGGTAADYISVSIGEVFRTPEVGRAGALNGTATSVTIPAGTLQTGSNYEATVTFMRFTGTSNSSYTTSASLATATKLSVIAGSAATLPLVFTNRSYAAGVFTFEVASSPGQSLTVEYSPTLQSNSWVTLRTTNSGSGLARFTHAATNRHLFYRVRKNP